MMIRKFLFGGVLSLAFSSVSYAFVSSDPAFDLFKATVLGNETTVVFGSNGTLIAKAPATISTAAAGLEISRKIPLAAGTQVLDVVATQTVSRAAVGNMLKVAAAAVGGPVGMASLVALAALPYIANYLLKNGVKVNPTGSASSPFETVDASGMNTCRVFGNGTLAFDGPTCAAAAISFLHNEAAAGAFNANAVVLYCAPGYCRWSPKGTVNPDTGAVTDTGFQYNLATYDISSTPSTSGSSLTPDQLADIISRSTVPIPPEILPELIKAGAPVVLPAGSPGVTLSGPTESAPFNTVKSDTLMPEGTTSNEEECVRHLIYAGPNVSIKDLCHSTFTYPDGTKSTTDTAKSVDPKKAVEEGTINDKVRPDPANSPASAAEPSKALCTEFPDIIACQKLSDPGSSNIPKLSKTISFTADDSFGSGSCPANKTMSVNGQVLTVVDWETHCGYIASYFRPILILLASYAALIMLVPDKT